jgi:ankyrin repeat protein
MIASRYGSVPLVRRLLAAGADPDAAIRGDGTPLIEAARNGHL